MLLALGACSDPPLDKLPPGSTILAFGDSLTAGVGAEPGQSYPDVLAALTGMRVINAGISGETTAEGRPRLARELDMHAPQLLVLMEGGNDILQNLSSRETKANLAAMIALAHDRAIPVLLIGVPEKNLFSSVAPFYRELAAEHKVQFDDELLSDLLRTSRYKSDLVHLNAQGYRAMAESIRERLADSGAL